MASSAATTVATYLAELPAERRAVVRAVRTAVRRAMPAGYKEGMGYGMITWTVPHRILPDTYNDQPLCYVALAAQKNYYALYLMGPYGNAALMKELRAGYKAAGIRLDMGKSCLRFKALDGIALDVVARVIAGVPMARFVDAYHASRRR
ncbi:MAG: DUF1801 domain-containing protein [Gemmatimonadota bacterium]|nr:DUF1801 domain-containing protein [Gemmatimonadota bacterium]